MEISINLPSPPYLGGNQKLNKTNYTSENTLYSDINLTTHPKLEENMSQQPKPIF